MFVRNDWTFYRTTLVLILKRKLICDLNSVSKWRTAVEKFSFWWLPLPKTAIHNFTSKCWKKLYLSVVSIVTKPLHMSRWADWSSPLVLPLEVRTYAKRSRCMKRRVLHPHSNICRFVGSCGEFRLFSTFSLEFRCFIRIETLLASALSDPSS